MEIPKWLLKEWDYERNLDNPEDLTYSGKKIVANWICPRKTCKYHEHRWASMIYARMRSKSKCPFCSKRKLCPCHSLAYKCPEIMKEWDWEKNKGINPWQYSWKSDKKVWWICKSKTCACEHRWKMAIFNRTKGKAPCPYCSPGLGRTTVVCRCNSLAMKFPTLLSQWDFERNNLDPWKIEPNSLKRVWWICKNKLCDDPTHEHRWQSMISSRTRNNNKGCPWCTARGKEKRICSCNSVAGKYPHLLKELHPTKNKNLDPTKLFIHSSKRIWWICSDCGHEWKTRVEHRTNGESGCPICRCSRGEKAIARWLNDMNMTYIYDKPYPGLKRLRFDFFLNINGSLIVIEFDGDHHFVSIPRFGGDKHLKDTQKRDLIKNKFCLENNISLHRIYYKYRKKIRSILKKIFSKPIESGIHYYDKQYYSYCL